jgi:hypothetical protein
MDSLPEATVDRSSVKLADRWLLGDCPETGATKQISSRSLRVKLGYQLPQSWIAALLPFKKS